MTTHNPERCGWCHRHDHEHLTCAGPCPVAPIRVRWLCDEVWCTTCNHTHIPAIPTTTFACTGIQHAWTAPGRGDVIDGADPNLCDHCEQTPAAHAGCGFGAWEPGVAAVHAGDYPDHIVHPIHHATVPLPTIREI